MYCTLQDSTALNWAVLFRSMAVYNKVRSFTHNSTVHRMRGGHSRTWLSFHRTVLLCTHACTVLYCTCICTRLTFFLVTLSSPVAAPLPADHRGAQRHYSCDTLILIRLLQLHFRRIIAAYQYITLVMLSFGILIPLLQLHFRRIIAAHTDVQLGDCSFLDTCRHMKVRGTPPLRRPRRGVGLQGCNMKVKGTMLLRRPL